MSIEIPRVKSNLIFTEEQLTEWRKVYSIKEIAKKTGYSYSHLTKIFKEHNIKICSSKCDFYKKEILEDIKNKITLKNMEEKYNIKSGTISAYIVKNKLRDIIS
jgi:Ca2+-binding EF-hand superfamily protein